MKKTIENRANNKSVLFLLQIVVIISILSQISELESVLRPLMYTGWLCILVYLTMLNGFKMQLSNFTMLFVISYIIYFLYCAILTMGGTEHLSSNYLKVLLAPLMVCVATDMIKEKNEEVFFQRVAFTYIFAATIFAIYINLKFFTAYDQWVDSTGYLFAQKNSAGQILGVAVLLNFFICRQGNSVLKPIKFLFCCLSIYFIVVIMLCKCRAVMLALICVVIVDFFINVKHKIAYIVILTIVVVIFILTPNLKQFIFKSLNLGKYAGNDINKFSSNRIELWKEAIAIFEEYPLFGVGNYYVDNSYVSILTESGIIGFLIIETIWVCRIVTNFKQLTRDRIYGGLSVCLTFFYIVESIFEAFPPFGPGVSSMFLWLYSEMYIDKENLYYRNDFML